MKALLVAIALLSLAACAPTPTQTVATSPTPAASPSPTAVTMAQYNRVKEGMNLAAVQAILGAGEQFSSSEFQGIKTEIWIWQNPDFSNVTVTLQNGVVLSKAQANIK